MPEQPEEAAPIMFTNPRPNLYESSEGFSVEVLGMTGMRYHEGTRQLFVYSEVLQIDGTVIYTGRMRHWDAPHQEETISDTERDRIVENIRKAFNFYGFELQVIRPASAQ